MQVVYRQIKQSKSENRFIKFACCHKNSWKLTQMLMFKRLTKACILNASLFIPIKRLLIKI